MKNPFIRQMPRGHPHVPAHGQALARPLPASHGAPLEKAHAPPHGPSHRSVSMSLFLYVLIKIRSGESPFAQIRRIGYPVIIAGLSLVAAYSGGIYSIQNTSVANG